MGCLLGEWGSWMMGELDPARVLAAVEEIIKEPESKNRQVPLKVEVNHFVSVAIFLVSIDRRQLHNAESSSLLEGEGLIHGLVGRFDKIFDGELPKVVDIEMSRKELDAVGNALIGWQEKAGKKRKMVNKMRAHVYDAYLAIDDVFIEAGGGENASLRKDIKMLVSVSKKR